MKIRQLISILGIFVAAACGKTGDLQLCNLSVTLYNNGSVCKKSGVDMVLKEMSSSFEYHALTDESGTAAFSVMPGVYDAGCFFDNFNGSLSGMKVFRGRNNEFSMDLHLVKTSPVIMKELYFSRCLDPQGKLYSSAAYMILYNNSDEDQTLHNYAIAQGCPSKADSPNPYERRGIDALGYVPALSAVWWFQQDVVLPAYSQIVVSIYTAIDHTQEIPASVDLSKADYVMYDPEVFSNARYYFPPYSGIDKSHYMKTFSYAGESDSWGISFKSPCFFTFQSESLTPEEFVKNMDNIEDPDGKGTMNCARVNAAWVQDGVEVYDSKDVSASHKRLASSVDAGYVISIERNGYSVYRNVDKAATEALEENKGKLVYGYAGGTQDLESGSTDPSDIDAEASMAMGAHIIYQDTNNSSKDFHLRKVASIKK